MKILQSFISLMLLVSVTMQAQTWQIWDESSFDRRELVSRDIIPDRYQSYKLSLDELYDRVLPESGQRVDMTFEIKLPLSDGNIESFECKQYDIMQSGIAARYPHIRAYRGKSKDGNTTVYFSIGDSEFHAAIRKGGKTWYIDPFARESEEYYILYNIADFQPPVSAQFSCGSHTLEDNVVRERMEEWLDLSTSNPAKRNLGGPGTGAEKKLFRYRLAVATTGEYTSFTGGTKATAMAAIVNIVNRVNSIYEVDNAISMQLVDNNDRIIYLNAATDPYSNGNSDAMIDENQSNVTSQIGSSNFDIGHLLGTANSVNGLARLYAVCNDAFKAMGASSHNNPTGDPFVVSTVCHEMGHQFSAFHTMYHCHNVTQFNAVEPGSGSSIMSYAGICSPAIRNIQGEADPYFHGNSLNQIYNYSRFDDGRNCPEKIDIGNTGPLVSLAHNSFYNIPIRTPFKLTGVASDAEDENLTYSWEQTDAGPYDPDVQPTLGSPQENAALFRSFPPSENPTRYFPSLDYLTQNEFHLFEILPAYQRNLSFSLTVRDNHPGGGSFGRSTMALSANISAGPFVVLSPTRDTSVRAGNQLEVTWDVANTDIAPVNCQKVDILLSTDGGMTYPTTLLYDTENDGTETVVIPDRITDQARIMVAAADNVFFDISDENFEIMPADQPAYYVYFENLSICVCLPDLIEIEIPTSSMASFSEPISFSLQDPGIPNADIRFASENISAGETAVLVLDMEAVEEEGDYTLQFRAESTNGVRFDRTIEIATVTNDFSGFVLTDPQDGASNVTLTPIFKWDRVNDADGYSFELATSPSFDPEDLIIREDNLLTGAYSLSNSLDQNQVYYWRVVAGNQCGLHSGDAFSFQTETVVCNTYASTGPAQAFPPNEAKTLTSDIEITEVLAVDDINIRGIRGSHNSFSDLSISLKSPDNNSVLLLDQKCGSPIAFDFGFDDESALQISACDFSEGKLLQPENPLSTLDGSSTNGIWTISIQDNEPAQGGTFFSWSIEMCATLSPSDPYLVRNDTLKVKPAKGRSITDLFLEAGDDDNGPSEITFTLVNAPSFGYLELYSTPITAGGTFTQSDIFNEGLKYKHEGGDETEDSFRFTISDPDGGFFGTPTFLIHMDTSVQTTAIINEIVDTELIVYPNPANNYISIESKSVDMDILRISLFDNQGRRILQRNVDGNSVYTLESSGISSGMYILHILTDHGLAVRKIILEHK